MYSRLTKWRKKVLIWKLVLQLVLSIMLENSLYDSNSLPFIESYNDATNTDYGFVSFLNEPKSVVPMSVRSTGDIKLSIKHGQRRIKYLFGHACKFR